jgi:alkanesulfonate monooxygenase SsuD/methylene tetrahydromethanopterin reductase-like flavin-dependent oxidoreductase (luciferase family)
VEYGAHLPLADLGSRSTPAGLKSYARAADSLGYTYLCANDHLLFTRPWLDGPTALAAVGDLSSLSQTLGRGSDPFPNALATTWLFITESPNNADRMITDLLAPMLNRDADLIRSLALPIGPAEVCAQRLSRCARAGARRILLWPLADEVRQLETFREQVAPLIDAAGLS